MITALAAVLLVEFTFIAVLFWRRRFHLERGHHAP